MERLKFILFGLNVSFWTMGFMMVTIGVSVAVDRGAFEALDMANAAGMDAALWSTAVYTFIAIGAFLFLVGLFECLQGVARADRSTFFLWLYVFSVGLMIMAEIVVFILANIYLNSISEDVAVSMYNDVHFKYINEKSPDRISSSWNKMQIRWKCCGSFGYQDYLFSNYHNNSDPHRIPYTCCIREVFEENEFVRCLKGIQEHVYQQGCYFALENFLNKSAPTIIILTCGVASLQVTGLLYAFFLIFGSERMKKHWSRPIKKTQLDCVKCDQ